MRTPLLRRLTVVAAAAALVVVGAPAPVQAGDADAVADRHRANRLKRVGYYTQWSNYSGFFVKNLATSGTAARLTHVNYAFGNVNAEGKCFEDNIPSEGDAWADYQRPYPAAESVDGVADADGQKLYGNFNQLRKLKAKYRNLKVLISLGGWTWSKNFSAAVKTPEGRRALVASCVDLYIKGNLPTLGGASGGPGAAAGVFDGIDVDWEWPGSAGNVGSPFAPEDKPNFTKLMAEFRRQLDNYGHRTRKHYVLSAFLPANTKAIDAGFEARKIFRSLDFGTLQGYDYHGPWETNTNHQSALRSPASYPQPDFSVVATVDAWRSRGAPSGKLVVGVPYFSHGWTDVPNVNNGLHQPGVPAPGLAPGHENFNNLAKLVQAGTFKVYRDTEAGHAWIFDGKTFWNYDDPEVLRQKMRYIRRADLGGTMIWSLDGDTADGQLTKAIYSGLGCG